MKLTKMLSARKTYTDQEIADLKSESHAAGYLAALITIEGHRRAEESRICQSIGREVYPIFPSEPNLVDASRNSAA